MNAVASGSLPTIGALVKAGAEVNAKDKTLTLALALAQALTLTMALTVNADAHKPVDREHGAWLDEGCELGVGAKVRVRVRDGAHCARLGGMVRVEARVGARVRVTVGVRARVKVRVRDGGVGDGEG